MVLLVVLEEDVVVDVDVVVALVCNVPGVVVPTNVCLPKISTLALTASESRGSIINKIFLERKYPNPLVRL